MQDNKIKTYRYRVHLAPHLTRKDGGGVYNVLKFKGENVVIQSDVFEFNSIEQLTREQVHEKISGTLGTIKIEGDFKDSDEINESIRY